MNIRQRRIVIGGHSFLGGIAAERMRFDLERSAAVARFDAVVRQLRAQMMTVERAAAREHPAR